MAGTRVSARVPLSSALVNRLVKSALADASAHVRDVEIHPQAADAFDVRITVTWPFVPAFTIHVHIERQPQFPADPVLVLRWSLLGAAGALASRFIASFDRLPPGVRLEGEHLLLDLRQLAARASATPLLPFVRTLEVHTVADRFVLDTEIVVDSA